MVGNDGLAHLTSVHWPKLIRINLANNKLDAQAGYYFQKAEWPVLQELQLSRNYIGMINSSEMTDLGCFRIGKMQTKQLKYFGFFGNSISLNGIRMIMRSPIFSRGCVLQLTKNNFRFDEIRGYLKEYELFCDQFQD